MEYTLRLIGRDFSLLSETTVQPLSGVAPTYLADAPQAGEPLRLNESGLAVLRAFLDTVPLKNLAVNGMESGGRHYGADPEKEFLYNGPLYGGFCGVITRDFHWTPKAKDGEPPLPQDTLHITLELRSRFDGERPYFLSEMLLSRSDIRLSNDTVPYRLEDLYDFLLVFRLADELREAARKGFYRTYQRFERNDDHPRGSIDIARHIRQNLGQANGKIAYAYRENTIDNPLNRLIVAAWQHIRRKYPALAAAELESDRTLLGTLNHLKQELGYDKNAVRGLLNKTVRPIAHPYYTEYEALRLTCRSILRDEGVDIFGGAQDGTRGFLFYLPTLWELYLEPVLQTCLPEGTGVTAQFAHRVFGKNKAPSAFVQEVRPDFVFTQGAGKTPYFILDAKYRKNWYKALGSPDGGPVSLPYLDDFDKCLRDMVCLGLHSTGVIFPVECARSVDLNNVEHALSLYNADTVFCTFGVQIPAEEGLAFLAWRAAFGAVLEDFAQKLQAVLCRTNSKKQREDTL